MDIVTIEIWHGGEVEVLPYSTRYVGGELFEKNINHVCLGIMEFFVFLEDLGYLNVNHFYYKFHGDDFEVGVKVLQFDGDVIVMVEKIKMEGHSVVQVLQSDGDVKVQFNSLSLVWFQCSRPNFDRFN
jgi:hypothetical protein